MRRKAESSFLNNLLLKKVKKSQKENSVTLDDPLKEIIPQILPSILPNIADKLSKDKDEEVYRKENHVYFKGDVNKLNVEKLCDIIDDINIEFSQAKHSSSLFIIPKPIYLHITSFGGSLFDSFIAYDHIKNSPIKVIAVGEGYVISAGTIIFLACNERYMTENSRFLIHQLSKHDTQPNTYEQFKDEFINSSQEMDMIKKIYIKSGLKFKESKLDEIMKHDLFWKFDECVKFGVCASNPYTNSVDRDKIDLSRINDFIHHLT